VGLEAASFYFKTLDSAHLVASTSGAVVYGLPTLFTNPRPLNISTITLGAPKIGECN